MIVDLVDYGYLQASEKSADHDCLNILCNSDCNIENGETEGGDNNW
jgi:hypothetical protein